MDTRRRALAARDAWRELFPQYPHLKVGVLKKALRTCEMFGEIARIKTGTPGGPLLNMESVAATLSHVLDFYPTMFIDHLGRVLILDARLAKAPYRISRSTLKSWTQNGHEALDGSPLARIQKFAWETGRNGRLYRSLDEIKKIIAFNNARTDEEISGYCRAEETGLTWDVLLTHRDCNKHGAYAGKPVPSLANADNPNGRPIRAKRRREFDEKSRHHVCVVYYNEEDCEKVREGTVGDRLTRGMIIERFLVVAPKVIPQMRSQSRYVDLVDAIKDATGQSGVVALDKLNAKDRKRFETVVDNLLKAAKARSELKPGRGCLPGTARPVECYTPDQIKHVFERPYVPRPGHESRVIRTDKGPLGPYREALGEANERPPGDTRPDDRWTLRAFNAELRDGRIQAYRVKELKAKVATGKIKLIGPESRERLQNWKGNQLLINLDNCKALRSTKFLDNNRAVIFRGRTYSFTPIQAAAVGVLRGMHNMMASEATIRERITEDGGGPSSAARFRMRDVFCKPATHQLIGKMIVYDDANRLWALRL